MSTPRPTPSALKDLRGNPGKRPVNHREPKPQGKLPPCPNWLPPVAKAKWNELSPSLTLIGVATNIDAGAFERYCLLYDDWKTCADFLVANGPDHLATDEAGKITGVCPFPHLKRKREIEVLLLRYESEFGLTPSSRSKMQVSPQDHGDELDDLLNDCPMKITG